jgi:predicted transcriptional regulator
MKLELINLLLFSDKRKDFLLLLADGPKSIDETLDLLQIPRVSLLPQIKKLKEEGLIVQEGHVYHLSVIGNILVKKAQPLLDSISVLEENEYYWSQRKLVTIPPSFLKRIGMLKNCQLIGSGIENWASIFPELAGDFGESAEVLLLFSYFHPHIPSFSLELVKKGVKLRLVLSKDSFESFCKDFHIEGEKILAYKNATIFVITEEKVVIPAGIAVTENKLLLGLLNKKGKFEVQYILSSESNALIWGRELCEYYIEDSKKVYSMNPLEDD